MSHLSIRHKGTARRQGGINLLLQLSDIVNFYWIAIIISIVHPLCSAKVCVDQ